MNKYYPVKQINSAWLVEVRAGSTIVGIKNIMGIVVKHDNDNLFYSILDDCFFRILFFDEDLTNNMEKYSNRIFAIIASEYKHYMPSIWKKLYEKVKRNFLTKEEIIANKNFITGHYSDFGYELETDTKVDYENFSTIGENTISSEPEYKERMGRPITYDENHIYGPIKKKKL